MKLLLFILFFFCLTDYSFSQDNFEQEATSSGFYFDEEYFFVMRIKNDSLKEVNDYQNWRKENTKILCINSLFGTFKNWGTLFYTRPPKVLSMPVPKIPHTAKDNVKRIAYVQFSVDTLGNVNSVELVDFLKGSQIDFKENKSTKSSKAIEWNKEILTQSDVDYIRECLLTVMSWECEPGRAVNKKVACIGVVPLKLSF